MDLVRLTDRLAVPPLVDALFDVLLARPEVPVHPACRARLAQADDADWERAFAMLSPHKVFALLHHQLVAFGLLEHLPASLRARLDEVHVRVRHLNMLHMLTAATALKACQAGDESLVVMKGLLFADSYYPDPSVRPMGDVDLVVQPGRAPEVFALLERAGFVRGAPGHDEDTVMYNGPHGVGCDMHAVMRMFEGVPFEALTVPVSLQHVRGASARRFEPNAMVAHLVAHFFGHVDDIGPVLLWVIDFAFVLRRHAHEIDPARVRALLSDDRVFGLFLRIVATLSARGEDVGSPLAARVRGVVPLSLGEVLRQRRLVPWRIPSARGFARLAVHALKLRVNEHRPEVEPSDLVLWPVDLVVAELTRRSVRADG